MIAIRVSAAALVSTPTKQIYPSLYLIEFAETAATRVSADATTPSFESSFIKFINKVVFITQYVERLNIKGY